MSYLIKHPWRGLTILVFLLASCAYIPLESSPYQDFESTYATRQTTREEIIQDMGPPNMEEGDYRYLLYEWEADGAFIAHPAVAVFACSSPVQRMPGFNRDTLIFEVDEDGVLVRSAVVRNPQADRIELMRRFQAGEALVEAEGEA